MAAYLGECDSEYRKGSRRRAPRSASTSRTRRRPPAAPARTISFGRSGSQRSRTRACRILGQAGGGWPGACPRPRPRQTDGREAARSSWRASRTRQAPSSGQPAGYSPAPRHVQQPGYRPAPPPVQPSGYRPQASGREPPAAQERAPLSQQEVPYQSLMDALSRATPAMLTEAEKRAPAERLPAIRKAQAASRRKPGWRSRLGWRSTVAISALVLTAGVSGYALLGHGGLSRLGKIAGMSQTGQTPSAIFSNGAWVNVPLPKRRPAVLRAEQGPGHGEPSSATD